MEKDSLLEWSDTYRKNFTKIRNNTRLINDVLITQRETERYFEEKGYFPEEFPEGSEGQLQFDYPRTKESKAYVTQLTERNETSRAKKPSRGKIFPPAVKPVEEKWKPPAH